MRLMTTKMKMPTRADSTARDARYIARVWIPTTIERSRRYDGRGVCTAARDDTTLAMVRSRRTARVDVDNFEQRLRLKRTKK